MRICVIPALGSVFRLAAGKKSACTLRTPLPCWFTLSVNHTPSISSVSNTSPHCGGALGGRFRQRYGFVTDADLREAHAAVIGWGDGISESGGVGTVTGSHAYVNGGIYTITVTVVDASSLSDAASTDAFISGAGVHNRILYVIGTDNDDHIP